MIARTQNPATDPPTIHQASPSANPQLPAMPTDTQQKNPHINPWFILSLGVLLFSILRGIRFPNLWSYTHYLFNYDAGFTKRGLIGEVVSRLDSPYLASYEFFLIFSAILFGINMILIATLARDLVRDHNPLLVGSALLFLSSSAIIFLAHTIGYFDHLGLMIALITLKIANFYRKILFLSLTLPIALLSHEGILVLFFPAIFMSLLFSIDANKKGKGVLLTGIFSLAALLFTFQLSNSTLTFEETGQLYNTLHKENSTPLRSDAFAVLYRTPEDNSNIMKRIWSKEDRPRELINSLLVTLPTVVAINTVILLILAGSGTSPLLIILAISASLSPLVLHLFAWDMHRWNSMAITTSFLMLVVSYNRIGNRRGADQTPVLSGGEGGEGARPGGKRDGPLGIPAIFLFLLFFNGAASIPLFDRYHVKQIPFVDHTNYIRDLNAGRATFPDVPNH
jgi:hypothetical protein